MTVAVDGRGSDAHAPAGVPARAARAATGRLAGSGLPGTGAGRPAPPSTRASCSSTACGPSSSTTGCSRARRSSPGCETRAVSPYVEVSGGLDGYLSRASKSGRDNIGQARRRTARAERELGPVTFCAQSSDADALAWLVDRKREQYAATGARDHFAPADRRALLSLLLDTHEPGCEGIMSTLHFGDTLVAAHFGIRSRERAALVVPGRTTRRSRASHPAGSCCGSWRMAAPELGLERIDLGSGRRRVQAAGPHRRGRGVGGSGHEWRGASDGRHRARRAAVTAAKTSPVAPLLRRAVHARSADAGPAVPASP